MTFPQNLTRWLIAALFIAISPLSTWAQAPKSITNVVTTEQVRAELMAYAPDGVDPGKTVWVGLQLAHQPHWHTYWKNSGDSGQPTSLSWTLPTGVLAGDIAWPTPKILPTGNLVTYGFNGTVLLPVPLTITPDFKPSPLSSELEVKLQASWLVCKLECVPQDGEFVLRLPVKSSTALNAGVFEASFQASPKPLAGQSQISIDGQQLKLTVNGLPTTLQGQKLELFPEVPELVDAGAAWTQAWTGAQWTASLPISAHRSVNPTSLPVVIVSEVTGQRSGFASTAPITGSWPTNPPPGQAEVAQPQLNPALSQIPATPAVPTSFWLALLGALLGGMLLNLMPCVFPVLAIKVVGFTRHADDRHGHRISGLAYSAGVVLSFVALGALMLALRSAGEQLGWGFQLQSPVVVAALATLFTVIGLNLAGLFEFGQLLPSRVATLQSSNPALNAFLSGVLAVAIASPCTAPFMGASLGLALALPPLQALLLFAALGVGMALPYLAASWSPALARKLPRPGPWMDTFRRAMAFPMFATVVWLVWVLGQQSGIDGAGALLALLVGLALVVWALSLRGATRLPIAAVSIAILLTLTWAIGKNVVHFAEPSSASTSANSRWQVWAPSKVDELLASGSPVFVDFTAAWCVTCQYNKKTTLANTELLADLEAKKVVLLRADWTRRDPAITTALAALGRNGVPVYVMYQPGKPPVVLSEILSVADVRGAMVGL